MQLEELHTLLQGSAAQAPFVVKAVECIQPREHDKADGQPCKDETSQIFLPKSINETA